MTAVELLRRYHTLSTVEFGDMAPDQLDELSLVRRCFYDMRGEIAALVEACEVYRQMLTEGPASLARATVFSMLDMLNAKAAEVGK